jgi:amino acid transporter
MSLGLINYITITLTYIFFHRACKAQGLDRRSFSYFAWFQPYTAYIAFVWMIIVTCVYGYPAYKPWSVSTFWSDYTMQIVIHEADLVWERPLLDAYEDSFLDPPTGFWREVLQMVGIGRVKGGNDKRKLSVANPSHSHSHESEEMSSA